MEQSIKLFFNFIFLIFQADAHAASSYTINYSLCDSLLGTKAFNCATPIHKQVLFFNNQTSGKWEPRLMNGLNYQGTWAANTSIPLIGTLVPGDFYLVNVASFPYAVGDWLVLNDSMTFERVANSANVSKVFGRVGTVVPTKGDYELDKLGDVDLAGKAIGDTLTYNGVNWIPTLFEIPSVTDVTVSAPLTVTNSTTTPAIGLPAASAATNGYLKSSDWIIFNSKESAVTAAGTAPTTKYYRGDKIFTTLDTSVVSENSNLYFSDARLLQVPLSGVNVLTTGTILDTDTVLSAFGKTQRQLNSLSSDSGSYLIKNSTDTLSGAVSLTSVITTSGSGDFLITGTPGTPNSVVNKTYTDAKISKAGDSVSGVLTLDNDLKIKAGSNYVTIKGDAALASDYTFTLPVTAGSAGYVLSTNGAGVTSWIPAPVSSGGGVGTVTSVTASAPLSVANGTTTPAITMPAATASVNGYLTSANWTTFNSKEPAIVAATVDPTKKFYRGDKTFTSIDSNILGTLLAGINTSLTGAIADGDSVLQAFGKTQNQLGTLATNGSRYLIKDTTDSITGVVTVANSGSLLLTYTPVGATDAVNKTYADTKIKKTGDTASGILTFDNDLKVKAGSNYVTLKGSASTASDYNLTLPIDDGSPGYLLSTDGNGVTSWVPQVASGVASVYGRTGAVVAASGDYTGAQITNSPAGNIAATTVQAAINELDSEKQSIASFAADVRGVLLDGLSLVTSTAVAAGDSILEAFGKLQAQISALPALSTKADLNNGTQTITALLISVLLPPAGDYDITNKAYVDSKFAQNLFYQAVSANYTVVAADNSKIFSVTNGATITLPDATAMPAGFLVSVKQMDTNSVTVNTTSSQLIDGVSTASLSAKFMMYQFANTGTGWIITSKYIRPLPAELVASPLALIGLNTTFPADGVCQNVTVNNVQELASSTISTTASTGFSTAGCTDTCSGQILNIQASCTVGVKVLGSNPNGAISGTLTVAATSGGSVVVSLSGTVIKDPCLFSPTPGTVCNGGAIYLGSLSPGATSGSGTDKYMTTPGGCGEIPAGQIVGSGVSAYPSTDFTPTCSGTDSLSKNWNDGTGNYEVVPGLTDYTTTLGTGKGAINIDLNYGSTNTTNIAAVTAGASGGYHAAARYCDKLNYGGYTDWYLPNRYELNLMWTNRASIPGLDTGTNWYWSSTEYNIYNSWIQKFDDGNQSYNGKTSVFRLRCVRRF